MVKMDGFDYNVNSSNEGDIIPDLGPSGDIECVMLGSEASALKPLVSISENLSINPIENPAYDFLCDNDFSRSIYSDLTSQPTGNYMDNDAYIDQDNAYLGFPLLTPVNDAKNSNSSSFENVGNYNTDDLFSANDFAMNSDCNYSLSPLNELFPDTVDQQNDSSGATENALQTPNLLDSNVNGTDVTSNAQSCLLESFSDAFQKSDNALRTSTPLKNIDMINNFCSEDFNIDYNCVQKPQIENNGCNLEAHHQNNNPHFLPNNIVSNNTAEEVPQNSLTKNILDTPKDAYNMPQSISGTSQLHLFDLYKNNMPWTLLHQQNHAMQPLNFVVLKPLQTRKCLLPQTTISSGNATYNLSNSLSNNSNISDTESKIPNQNNAQNLDSIDFNMPISKSDNSPKSTFHCDVLSQNKIQKSNRRKQNLSVIPGAEHVSFEIRHEITRNEIKEPELPSLNTIDNPQKKIEPENPYREIELPELDEIFGRKNRSCKISNFKSKLSELTTSDLTNNAVSVETMGEQFNIIQETSTSFEEKISVSRTVSRGICNSTMYNSDSDSGDQDCQVVYTKSLKCRNCKKMFKTARSLAIHMKHCVINIAEINNNKLTYNSGANSKLKMKDGNDTRAHLIANSTDVNDNKCKNNNLCTSKKLQTECEGPSLRKKSKSILKEMEREQINEKNQARPMTRSQTRQSVDQIKSMPSSKRTKKLK